MQHSVPTSGILGRNATLELDRDNDGWLTGVAFDDVDAIASLFGLA